MDEKIELEEVVKLSFFTEIGKDIVKETTMRGVLSRVMEHIGKYFTSSTWSLLLFDEKNNELVFKLVTNNLSDRLIGVRIPSEEGIAGWVLKNGMPLIIQDVETDARFSSRIDKMIGFKTNSVIAVPLRTSEETIGVIELINKPEEIKFTTFELHVLSTIADFAGIALEKAFYLQTARKLALTDHLTTLYNRRGLDRIIFKENSRLKRYGGIISIIIGDIDGFKAINDGYGHAAGDDILKAVGAILKRSVRDSDSVARYGGDEFVILMPNTNLTEAETVKKRIEQEVKNLDDPTIPKFTISLGLHSSENQDIESILYNSDKALYKIKEAKNPLRIKDKILDAFSDTEHEFF